MDNKERDKMMTGARNKTEAKIEEYFFSGGGEYIPVTVSATSKEEAQSEWEKVRQPVGE